MPLERIKYSNFTDRQTARHPPHQISNNESSKEIQLINRLLSTKPSSAPISFCFEWVQYSIYMLVNTFTDIKALGQVICPNPLVIKNKRPSGLFGVATALTLPTTTLWR